MVKHKKSKKEGGNHASEDEMNQGPETKRMKRTAKTTEAEEVQTGGKPADEMNPETSGNDAEEVETEQGQETGENHADEDVPVSLLKIRSLLTPAGYGKPAKATPSKPATSTDPILDWTSRTFVVNTTDPHVPIEELPRPLHPSMERSLRSAGYTKLFPIQAAVIPLVARSAETFHDQDSPYCCDVCVAAPTGQGKTLAYAVPIVQALLNRLAPRPRALVVVPTRDLAMQVFRVFDKLRPGLGPEVVQVRACCFTGQKSLKAERRILEKAPPDVVICTPGRLAAHYLGRDSNLDLTALRWFVVDEADRLLMQSFHRWLDVLDRVATPLSDGGMQGMAGAPRLQKLLLSATMTWNPQKLAMLKLHRPLYFFSSVTGKHTTPAELQQHYVTCKVDQKPLLVLHLLKRIFKEEENTEQRDGASAAKAVVFCSSVDAAHRLARFLQICALGKANHGNTNGAVSSAKQSDALEEEEEEQEEGDNHTKSKGDRLQALALPELLQSYGATAEFTSNLTQSERSKALQKFRKAKIRCLVCSDVVARGIDIPAVSAVINYTAPDHLQTYIHRVGRTARAGRTGHTFTLVRFNETIRFKRILRESADCWERIQKCEVPREVRDTQQAFYQEAMQLLERCLELESKGHIVPSVPISKNNFQLSGSETLEGSHESINAAADRKRKRLADKEEQEPISTPSAAAAEVATKSLPTTHSSGDSLMDFVRSLSGK